jgi:hypothetical protein
MRLSSGLGHYWRELDCKNLLNAKEVEMRPWIKRWDRAAVVEYFSWFQFHLLDSLSLQAKLSSIRISVYGTRSRWCSMNWPNRARGSWAAFLKPRCDSHKHATLKRVNSYFHLSKRAFRWCSTFGDPEPGYLLSILLGVASSKVRQHNRLF